MNKIKNISEPEMVDKVFEEARSRSKCMLAILRKVAENTIGDSRDVIIGVNGSIARRETTIGSDVDLFVLSINGDTNAAKKCQNKYRNALNSNEHDIKMPASGGVFEKPLPISELSSNIGGDNDTNIFITRRMLYLLEGEWIINQDGFERLRKCLIKRYVPDDLEEHKICQFLLNDVVRYWRTICVDFEFKTAFKPADETKSRAIRLVKLRLSRMMLYFAGVAAIRETADKSASQKRKTLEDLLKKPPVDRLIKVFGKDRTADARASYAIFECN